MGKRGPKPKSKAELKDAGTYRADRHANRGVDTPGGVIRKPRGLSTWASWLWDKVVPDLVKAGIVRPVDTPMLIDMCKLYGIYRRLLTLAEDDPLDRDTRMSLAAYATRWERWAARFGLSPGDRANLNITPPEDTTKDPNEDFFN